MVMGNYFLLVCLMFCAGYLCAQQRSARRAFKLMVSAARRSEVRPQESQFLEGNIQLHQAVPANHVPVGNSTREDIDDGRVLKIKKTPGKPFLLGKFQKKDNSSFGGIS